MGIPSLSDMGHRFRDAAGDASMLARLTRDLPGYLRQPLSLDDTRAALLARLGAREQRFLASVDRAVYGYLRSPALALLRNAGCEPGDLRALVRQDGVDGALASLADRGVYVTLEELKGRVDAVRGSQRFRFRQEDFNNPLTPSHFPTYTSGSGGQPSKVPRSLALAAENASTIGLALRANGIEARRHVLWLLNPSTLIFGYLKLGHRLDGWLFPVASPPWQVQVSASLYRQIVRASGGRVPRPRPADIADPAPLKRWLQRARRTGGPLIVSCLASAAVRLSEGEDADLEGIAFVVQGEPVTPARRATIERAGAQLVVDYGSREIQTPGLSCGTPQAADDVHVFEDRYAVIQRQRQFDASGGTVPALHFTSISDLAPKIVLNGALGDYGDLTRRACGCLLGELGLTLHLSGVRSHEKLTSGGVTFEQGGLLRVVEHVLPTRFGGTPLDYQVIEEESPSGAPRLVLRVRPSVGPLDEADVRAAFLSAVGDVSIINRYQADLWDRARTVVVERGQPLVSGGGKVLPFHPLRSQRGAPTPTPGA